MTVPGDWWRLGNCRGMGPELFYPGRGEDASPALAVCRDCPVAEPCLEFAIAHNEPGVWGETTADGRRRIRRRRKEGAA